MKNNNSKVLTAPPVVSLKPNGLRYTQSFYRKPLELDPVSKTIPLQAYTIGELYQRYAVGQIPPALDRATQWAENPAHSDVDLSKLATMDYYDRQTLLRRNKGAIEGLLVQLDVLQGEKKEGSNVTQMASGSNALTPEPSEK